MTGGIISTVIPKKYVKVQATAPDNAVQGDLWVDSDNNIVYQYTGSAWSELTQDLGYLNQLVLQQSLAVLALQADQASPSTDYNTIFLDKFSDADGYNDTVNTGNTTANFNTDKYEATVAGDPVVDTTNFNPQGNSSQTTGFGMKLLTKDALTLTKVTKVSACTATRAVLQDASGTPIATANFTGDDATFNEDLADATEYWIICDSNGGSYDFRQGTDPTFPVVKTNVNWTANGNSGSPNTSNTSNVASITTNTIGSGSGIVETDAITLDDNPVAYMLYCNKTVSGDGAIDYDIKIGSGAYQTGKALNTKYTNSDAGTTATLKINLDVVDGDDVAEINDYALLVWY